MLDASTATVIASEAPSMQEAGRALAAKLLDHGVRAPQAGEHGPLLLIGREEDVDRLLSRSGLPARPASLRGHGSAQVWAAYDESGQTVVCVAVRDAAALQALMRPLPHYGRQSWLIFEGSKAIERGVWAGEPALVRLSD
jgi:hypothetical protein